MNELDSLTCHENAFHVFCSAVRESTVLAIPLQFVHPFYVRILIISTTSPQDYPQIQSLAIDFEIGYLMSMRTRERGGVESILAN